MMLDETDVIKELAETSARSKSNLYRIDSLDEEIKEIKKQNNAIYEMATSVKLIAKDIGNMKSDMSDIKDKQTELSNNQVSIKAEFQKEIEEVREAPIIAKAKFVDDTRKKIIAMIVTGLAAYILGTIAPTIFK